MTARPLPVRHNPRLKGYDYTQSGAYFVTLCTHNREHFLGEVAADAVQLSTWGQIAADDWAALPQHYSQVELDVFVVMPNHLHGVLLLVGNTAAPSLSQIMGGYKAGVTRRIRALPGQSEAIIWQRSFFDRIIRSEAELNRIRQYIVSNPARWLEDSLYNP